MDDETRGYFEEIRRQLVTLDGKVSMLDGRVAALDRKIDSRVGRLDAKFDGKFTTFEGKFDRFRVDVLSPIETVRVMVAKNTEAISELRHDVDDLRAHR
jgi:hypothetical protein